MTGKLDLATMVRVRWLDSGMAITKGWASVEDYAKDATTGDGVMEAETVGYLVFEDDDIVLIAQTLDIGNGQMLNAQAIAKDCIYGRERLGRGGVNED